MYFDIYQNILDEIKSIRPKNPPNLIAVSKTYPTEVIHQAHKEGIQIFGENKIKEGIEKFSDLRKNNKIELHHIGPLQTGTLKKLFGNFEFTHGVGSLSALFELKKQAEQKKILIHFFLQANLTDEDTKSGFEKKDLIEQIKIELDQRNQYCKFHGLMTMGPSDGNMEVTKNVFSTLNEIRIKYCPDQFLSMGMSGDYKIATENGSDYIRVGSAIFGKRNYI